MSKILHLYYILVNLLTKKMANDIIKSIKMVNYTQKYRKNQKWEEIQMRKILKIVVLIIILSLISNILLAMSINSKVYAQSTSSDISGINNSKYPGIKSMIQSLQSKYPNWNFKILYTGLDWSEVIANEYTGHGTSPKNLVQKATNYQGQWICAICGEKGYDNGSWRCCSEQAIKYMMDPRNSLNASDIFQFEELTYTECTTSALKVATKGTFLSGHESAILKTAKSNNVNAYYIVARLIQEQGSDGTVLTSGAGYNGQYSGYYNAFNIAASGNSTSEILTNALAYAKKQEWTSLDKSISGGISFLASEYIAKGQNTLYLQKFNVTSYSTYSHQYMQNVMAAQSEGTSLRKTYQSMNAYDTAHTFIIPVYENMPTSACARPDTSIANTTSTDYVKVNVNSSIRLRNEPNGATTVGWLYKNEIVTRLEKATSKVAGTYWDKVQKSNGTTGYVARETFESESEYKLYLVPLNDTTSTSNNSTYNKGDVNNDGTRDSADLLYLKKYLLNKATLNSTQKTSADANGDGSVDSADLLYVVKFLLGKITL